MILFKNTENVAALQKVVDKMDPSPTDRVYTIRGFLSNLIPIGPLLDWEEEYSNTNRSTPEEVVGWMEGKIFISCKVYSF